MTSLNDHPADWAYSGSGIYMLLGDMEDFVRFMSWFTDLPEENGVAKKYLVQNHIKWGCILAGIEKWKELGKPCSKKP